MSEPFAVSSPTIVNLAAALALAQAEITNADKSSENPYFRTRYADLASVWDACRAPLSKNGLSVIQLPEANGAVITVTTILLHASGEHITSTLTMTAQRQLKDGGGWEKVDSPQAVGSTITYARRYALAAMVGVAPDDDDAESGHGRSAPTRATPPPRTPPPSRAVPPAPEGITSANFAPAPTLPWPDRASMEAAFNEMKTTVGETHYFYVISAHGISPDLKGKASKIAEAYSVLRLRATEIATAEGAPV